MLSAGVMGFKCFLIHSGVDDFPSVDRSDLEKAFQVLQGTSTVVLVGTINEYFKFLNRLCDMLITIISWDYLNLSVGIITLATSEYQHRLSCITNVAPDRPANLVSSIHITLNFMSTYEEELSILTSISCSLERPSKTMPINHNMIILY